MKKRLFVLIVILLMMFVSCSDKTESDTLDFSDTLIEFKVDASRYKKEGSIDFYLENHTSSFKFYKYNYAFPYYLYKLNDGNWELIGFSDYAIRQRSLEGAIRNPDALDPGECYEGGINMERWYEPITAGTYMLSVEGYFSFMEASYDGGGYMFYTPTAVFELPERE